MIRANKKRTFIGFGLAALLLALALGLVGMGCANDQGEGERAAVFKKIAPEDIPTVGLDVCTNCHTGQTTQWLTGTHGNLEAIDHATYLPLDLALDSDGFPYYAYFTDETCATCHDPLGDGQRLTAGWTGNVPRPVIGCESCHGGGAQHYGVGPIAFPKPDHNRCGQCHNASFPAGHLTYHPNGADILEDYERSGHFNSINEHTLATALTATPEDVRATCSRCHTDEGFRMYIYDVPGTLGYDSIGAILDDQPATEDASPVECRTCHDPHTADAGDWTRLKASVLNGDTQSGEFNQCTACHQLNKTDGTVQTQAYHDPSVNPYGSEEENITDNHAAVPRDTRGNCADWGGGTSCVTPGANLYFVKKGDPSACAVCHNPHSAEKTINEQYEESGHGETTAAPWIDHDWKLIGNEKCQRCHTSTGFKRFADDQTAYVYPLSPPNDMSYLNSMQMESIYCWACHTDYKGGIRNPGPFQVTTIETTNYKTMDGSSITFPDASTSSVCIPCHSGRVNGYAVKVGTGYTNAKFKNSHYLAAAGVLFRTIGFLYSDTAGNIKDYSNVSYFEHDQIGIGDLNTTGTDGPCATCHMANNPTIGVGTRKVAHLFSPVTLTGDTITGIATDTCAKCHTGEYEMTAEELLEEEEDWQAGMAALQAQLAKSGTPYLGAYPYFAQQDWTKNYLGVSTGSDAIGAKNMGAAFNWNALRNEPGSFTHNRVYTKRLIYDSIDWLDNNVLDASLQASLPGLLTGETLTKAQAYFPTSGRP